MSVSLAVREASRILAEHRGKRIPVNVERLAKSIGLSVMREQLAHDISGLLVTNSRSATVIVNSDHAPTRQRFTIAHEIGHYILGHQFEDGGHVHIDRGNYISQRGPRAAQGVDPKEIEANWFAASLLMPEDTLRDEVEKLSVAALCDSHVEDLARLFRVSDHAMSVRLAALHFL